MRNQALADALEKNGIRSEWNRAQFAESVGVNERTLRRWLSKETRRPQRTIAKIVARKLNTTPEDLWPTP